MHDISTQVLRVNPVPSRDGQSIRHVVSLSGGMAQDGTVYPAEDYVTFDSALGAKAMSLQGQPTDARVDIQQKPKRSGSGFFTNFILEDIAPQGMLQPMAMPTAGGTPAQPLPQPTPAPQPVGPQTPPPAPVTHPMLAGQEEDKSEQRRGFASRDALEFVGKALASGMFSTYQEAVQTAIALADDLVRYRSTGSTENAPEQGQAAEAAPVAAASTVPFDSPQQPPAA